MLSPRKGLCPLFRSCFGTTNIRIDQMTRASSATKRTQLVFKIESKAWNLVINPKGAWVVQPMLLHKRLIVLDAQETRILWSYFSYRHQKLTYKYNCLNVSTHLNRMQQFNCLITLVCIGSLGLWSKNHSQGLSNWIRCDYVFPSIIQSLLIIYLDAESTIIKVRNHKSMISFGVFHLLQDLNVQPLKFDVS